jgi:hypothetical protein
VKGLKSGLALMLSAARRATVVGSAHDRRVRAQLLTPRPGRASHFRILAPSANRTSCIASAA